MKIELHITECTPAELAVLARVLGGVDNIDAEIERTAKPKKKDRRGSYNRSGINLARPVYGIDKEGNWKEWESVRQMTLDLGVGYNTGRYSIDTDTDIKGYLLTFERPAELGPEPEKPKQETPAEVMAKIEEARQQEAEVEEVRVEQGGPTKARAVCGIHDNGKRKRWSSTTACCTELGVSHGTVNSACNHYKKVQGWMLYFDE